MINLTKIEIFFSNLFPKNTLKNKIVSTILYDISQKLKTFKSKIDATLNTDI